MIMEKIAECDKEIIATVCGSFRRGIGNGLLLSDDFNNQEADPGGGGLDLVASHPPFRTAHKSFSSNEIRLLCFCYLSLPCSCSAIHVSLDSKISGLVCLVVNVTFDIALHGVDERTDIRIVTWLPKFLSSIGYHFFLPIVLRCTRFARASVPCKPRAYKRQFMVSVMVDCSHINFSYIIRCHLQWRYWCVIDAPIVQLNWQRFW